MSLLLFPRLYFSCDTYPIICIIIVKRVKKRSCSFTHVQTRLATNQIAAGCEKLFQNVDIVVLFATKSVRVGVLPAQGKLVLRQVT